MTGGSRSPQVVTRAWRRWAGGTVSLCLSAFALAATGARLAAQIQEPAHGIKPSDGMRHASGELVAPVYEGWYRDHAGTLMLSFGYFNRNFKQELDVPVGPDNKIDPGPPDQGQPTHFIPRRQWAAFAVPVSKEAERRLMAEKKAVTWTLRANAQAVTIPANLGPAYKIDALKEPTVGNTPPVLRFEGAPASGAGPRGAETSIKAVTGTPVTVRFSVADDKRVLPLKKFIGVTLTWARYRGAGAVLFADATKSVDGGGEAAVTVTFAEPGDYVLRVEASDTEIHDFHCCWTNGYIHATVGDR